MTRSRSPPKRFMDEHDRQPKRHRVVPEAAAEGSTDTVAAAPSSRVVKVGLHLRSRKQIRARSKPRLFEEEEEEAVEEEEIPEVVIDPLDDYMQKLGPASPMQSSKKPKAVLFHEDEDSDHLVEEAPQEEEFSWLKKTKVLKKKEIRPVDHASIQYLPFRKDFYKESDAIASMTPEEVAAYRRDQLEDVQIRGKRCPNPIKEWVHCGLPSKIFDVIERMQYKAPFPIQAQAIPCIMSGRDVIACAKTGSGKTLAFVLPMLRHVMDQPPLQPHDGPIGLILAPTRELAIQISIETKRFAKPLNLNVVCLYGGAQVAEQIAQLRRGAEIVVATPGRMIDMLCTNQGRVTNLQRVTFLTLDEADRMFDMGFEPQIASIVRNIRPDRQTVMFSATFPRQIEVLARQTLKRPIEIVIGGRSIASDQIEQHVVVCEERDKFRKLLHLLGNWYDRGSILVFTDKQESVDKLFQSLLSSGYQCLSLHGGMDQSDRDFTLIDFKKKVKTIMIATSVAARGLDVKDLNLVVNYSVPNHYEDYVHRIGRTGRAGTKGTAYTFITPDEERYAEDLVKALEHANQTVPVALRQLAGSHDQKKEDGLVQYRTNDGYSSSKGFKFDEKEASKALDEQKRQMQSFGMVEDDVSDTEASPVSDEEETLASANVQQQLEKAKKAAAMLRAAMKGGRSAETAARVAKEMARTLSNDADLAKNIRLVPGCDNRYCGEFEINDFPQHARWKVTQKASITEIQEAADVIIMSKGSYVPEGKMGIGGRRKLYLYIEGRSAQNIANAKREIKRMLGESFDTEEPEAPQYSRYKVV